MAVAKKTTKLDVMQLYIKQLQAVEPKSFSAKDFGEIVDALGPANYNLDASLVAASDPKELEGVYTKYVADELKVTDQSKGMKMIAKVALKMKPQRRKYRAVFYYLLKLEVGK
jgi:hypothetical protein